MLGTEIIVADLEKAQRARFAKAKDPYMFFAEPNEAAVYQEILDLQENLKRDQAPRRLRRGGLRGRRPEGPAPWDY